MTPWFWRLYAVVSMAWTGFVVANAVGPELEARFAPVRIEQRIRRVERVEDRLCWDWLSAKVRDRASDDIDVYLWVDGTRMVMSVHQAASGMPWSRSAATGLGRHRLRYCTILPPHIRADQALRLQQTAWFPSALGPWRVPLRIPDVLDPPPPEASSDD